ncbi:MAG TPA: hypothetical protein VGL40_04915 [Bacillota bacterium]
MTGEPTEVSRKLNGFITRFEKATARRTFVLVGQFGPDLPELMLSECSSTLGQVLNARQDIDLILESEGGSVDSAYKAAVVLRQFAKSLRVFVPGLARSAATLFCLSADEVVMSPIAELGPLDAEVPDPRDPGKSMSALDGYQSVEYIRGYALGTRALAMSDTLNNSDCPVSLNDAMDRAADLVQKLISPMISRIEPLDFGGWGRVLDIGREYAERLLLRRGVAAEQARAIAYRLTYAYPHHRFVVDLLEAKESLGLNISPMAGDLYDIADGIVRLALSENGQTYVGFASKERLGQAREGQAPEAGEPPAPEPKEPRLGKNKEAAPAASLPHS